MSRMTSHALGSVLAYFERAFNILFGTLAQIVRVAQKAPMPTVFVTGSTTGLGRATAGLLLDTGHQVVLHARSTERAAEFGDLAHRTTGIVIGDLANAAEVRSVAEQANSYGQFDAVIHNAGVYLEDQRVATDDGHARVLAINVADPVPPTTWHSAM